MPISAAESRRCFLTAGYTLLPVTAQHAVTAEALPSLHADPFDRMLIAKPAPNHCAC